MGRPRLPVLGPREHTVAADDLATRPKEVLWPRWSRCAGARTGPAKAGRRTSLTRRGPSGMPVVVTAADRASFTRCRRQWDFGAALRQNLERRQTLTLPDLDRAVRDALAVYYFPGMWDWDRTVRLPLVGQELARALTRQRQPQRGAADSGADDENWQEALDRGQARSRPPARRRRGRHDPRGPRCLSRTLRRQVPALPLPRPLPGPHERHRRRTHPPGGLPQAPPRTPGGRTPRRTRLEPGPRRRPAEVLPPSQARMTARRRRGI
jgi:hypothetical protein